MFFRGLVMLLSLVLLSCKMGPDYSRPGVDSPASFRMATTPADAPSIANLPWWELLRDEELQRLIRIALDGNKDLQEAVATVEEFQARFASAKVEFAPQVQGTGNVPLASSGGFSISGFPTPFSYYYQTQLNWELDVWGRIRRTNEAARAQLLAKEENRRGVILGLISNVAQAYFDLRQLDLQLNIATRTQKSWEEALAIATVRLEYGDISQLDADHFDAELAATQSNAVDLNRQTVQKENELSLLLGRNPTRIPRGRPLIAQTMPPEVPPGLPSELLERRPDILVAEHDLEAATATIGIKQAERFPKISLTGALGVASSELSTLLGQGAQFGFAGLGLAGPLLNAQVLGMEKRAAVAKAKQALARYEKSVLVAMREVEDALIAVSAARDQRIAQESQVRALQRADTIANLRYQSGEGGYLDVLTAQRNLFQAELSLANVRRLGLVSIVQLYKALGGGWSPEEARGKEPVPVSTKRND